jgi:hypothetical protein
VVHLGWWRQQHHATYGEMHAALAAQVRMTEYQVRSLSQEVSLLLAYHEHQHTDLLAQLTKRQGDLIVALDGLAPQEGEQPM